MVQLNRFESQQRPKGRLLIFVVSVLAGSVSFARGRLWQACAGTYRRSTLGPEEAAFILCLPSLDVSMAVSVSRSNSRLQLKAGRDDDEKRERGKLSRTAGGAVLGGLLLGPLGAIFGTQLGSRWQVTESKKEVDDLGLDADMVKLAQSVALELAEAMESKERLASIKEGIAARAVRLEDDVLRKAAEAMEALSESEALARKHLESKLQLQAQLTSAKAELAKALQRCAAVDRSIEQLEQRALEVAALLERARSAQGPQRLRLADEASARMLRDPLLEKFDALERGDR